MKFSLIHPSRNRVDRCKDAMELWNRNFSNSIHTIEYILSVDNDDPCLEEYRALAKKYGANIVIGNNTCCVDATNNGATHGTGDIMILVSDDFKCPYNWDILLSSFYDDISKPQIFQVNDGITKAIITIPIMNSAAYKELGYIYYPEYKSMFADNDLRLVAEANGWLVDISNDVTFEHHHWVNKKAEKDEGYIRQENPDSWRIGQAVYAKRKLHFSEMIAQQNAKRFN
jgi:hypothetical protein